MNRVSDCQCQCRDSPGFDPSILRFSGIWVAAVEAVLNKVKKIPKNPHINQNHLKWEAGTGRTLLTVVLLRGVGTRKLLLRGVTRLHTSPNGNKNCGIVWYVAERHKSMASCRAKSQGSPYQYLKRWWLLLLTSPADRMGYCGGAWIDIGLNKGRGWFLNFLGAPLIFHWQHEFLPGKPNNCWLFNVTWLILVSPY